MIRLGVCHCGGDLVADPVHLDAGNGLRRVEHGTLCTRCGERTVVDPPARDVPPHGNVMISVADLILNIAETRHNSTGAAPFEQLEQAVQRRLVNEELAVLRPILGEALDHIASWIFQILVAATSDPDVTRHLTNSIAPMRISLAGLAASLPESTLYRDEERS